jgi:hypothetical protein
LGDRAEAEYARLASLSFLAMAALRFSGYAPSRVLLAWILAHTAAAAALRAYRSTGEPAGLITNDEWQRAVAVLCRVGGEVRG